MSEESSTFPTPEEGRSVLQPKRCDKHRDRDDDNSPYKVYNIASQKYRQKSNQLEMILTQMIPSFTISFGLIAYQLLWVI